MSKNILVVGGGSDLGGAISRKLSPGNRVVSTYFKSHREASELPGEVVQCDLGDISQIDAVFEKIGGKVDVLVTSAFPFLEHDNLDFSGYLETEAILRGHVYAMMKAANGGGNQGNVRILNILGQCVERGLPGGAFYSASFAYMHNLGNSINAREGKKGTVEVCDLLLGPADTREWDGLSAEVVQRYRDRTRSFITPQQVADTADFLLSQPVMPSTFKLDGYYGY